MAQSAVSFTSLELCNATQELDFRPGINAFCEFIPQVKEHIAIAFTVDNTINVDTKNRVATVAVTMLVYGEASLLEKINKCNELIAFLTAYKSETILQVDVLELPVVRSWTVDKKPEVYTRFSVITLF